MRAVQLKQFGGADEMFVGEMADPTPQAGQVLIRVAYTALNRADIMQRQGNYAPPPGDSEILGLEVSGTIESVGEGVSEFVKGDRVCALLGGGGYAELAVADVRCVMSVPEGYELSKAAAIPEAFLTAYQALFWVCRMGEDDKRDNQRVLLHAGASGVGTSAIQLARAAGASNLVVVTAGSQEKLDFCKSLGAHEAINYKEGPFADKVLSATDGKGVDVLVDFVGAPYWDLNIKSLAPDGRMVMLGFLGGVKLDSTSLGPIIRKRLSINGSTLRARTLEYKGALVSEFSAFAWPLLKEGKIAPVVAKEFAALDDIVEAHRFMEASKNIGKIVVRVAGAQPEQ